MQFLRILILLIVVLAASTCSRFRPSDFFRGLDTNGDRSVDLQEWMHYYGPHDHAWENCAGNDFEKADCDGNLVLSWEEYHSARFESDFCGDAEAHLTIYQKPRLDPVSGRYVTLPPACRIDLSNVAGQSQLALASPGSLLSMCERFGSPLEE